MDRFSHSDGKTFLVKSKAKKHSKEDSLVKPLVPVPPTCPLIWQVQMTISMALLVFGVQAKWNRKGFSLHLGNPHLMQL